MALAIPENSNKQPDSNATYTYLTKHTSALLTNDFTGFTHIVVIGLISCRILCDRTDISSGKRDSMCNDPESVPIHIWLSPKRQHAVIYIIRDGIILGLELNVPKSLALKCDAFNDSFVISLWGVSPIFALLKQKYSDSYASRGMAPPE